MSASRTRIAASVVISLVGLAALVIAGFAFVNTAQEPRPEVPSNAIESSIVAVVDGDTVIVAATAELERNTSKTSKTPGHIIRLLGIDAPEMNVRKSDPMECGAQAASDHLRTLLPVNTRVLITYDTKADEKDRYGRSLAYIATSQVSDVNLAMVTSGYAAAWIPKSAPRPDRFEMYTKAGEQAREALRGSYGKPERCTTLGR